MVRLKFVLGVSVLSLAMFSVSFAARTPPPCLDEHNNVLPVNNDNVLLWKVNTSNQTLKRAHISGTVKTLYPNHNGHTHFSAQIGPKPTDTIEVIYNIEFGAITKLNPGMKVESCGDYITSIAPASGYEASPDGAIIHWIHQAPKPSHQHGFLVLDGTVYGQFH